MIFINNYQLENLLEFGKKIIQIAALRNVMVHEYRIIDTKKLNEHVSYSIVIKNFTYTSERFKRLHDQLRARVVYIFTLFSQVKGEKITAQIKS